MGNYSLIFLNDIDNREIIPQSARPLLHENIIKIIDKAYTMSGLSDNANVYCFEYMTEKFEQLLSQDQGNLSIGTAISSDGVYFSPKHIWGKYYLDPDYRRYVHSYGNTPEKLNYDQCLKEYLIQVLCGEIKRFDVLRHT